MDGAVFTRNTPNFILYSASGEDQTTSVDELLSNGKPLIVQIYAEWWQPCIPAALELQRLSEFYGKSATFALVNISGPKSCQKFAETHQLKDIRHFYQGNFPDILEFRYIPHTIVFRGDGTVIKNNDFSGTNLEETISSLIPLEEEKEKQINAQDTDPNSDVSDIQ